ncbi:MAG: hypothetical protein A2231_10025 [Candidatus Firestonebacteria bacterium RIFOXYA2_FULL_40_8]|nr:MAG: hypothetical protein A2231_10025 [Candidatus Firestonebacteria bacterium RIFOXYA2_FULL_40_8]
MKSKMFLIVVILGINNTLFAAIENLDEVIARKARYSTNTWPANKLEDANNNYIWQPESLCYTDVTTGHEVWVLVHAPDIEQVFSREHGSNVWSFDGSRVGFFNNSESNGRPTSKPSPGSNYNWRWVVNTDGTGLKLCEGYGRSGIPFEGFSWAHTENAYYAFGSGSAEASDSANYKLFKNVVGSNNIITGSLVLDTSSVNTYKKDMVKDGISTDDSHAVFRDFTERSLSTPNPINCAATYFAALKPAPALNSWWGNARHIGPSTGGWSDPYGDHLSSYENRFHDVWSPGPAGSWIMGQYSGGGLFNIFKSNGSAGDGGPLWQDWNGSSFGANEIAVISCDGTPANPYGTTYFGHPVWDRWGKYALIGTYTDSPAPGTRIYNYSNHSLESNYPLNNNVYDGQHHSWTGWTDYVIGVHPTSYIIYSNKWNGNYSSAFQVVNTHLTYVGNYNAYPRPSQSPDGTKVAFAASFLNNTSDGYPSILYAVVYYPAPPVNINAAKNGSNVRLSWTRPSYTTRGWPNEGSDPAPKSREIKGYHIWVSDNGETGWTEAFADIVLTEYCDLSQINSTVKYYAVTSEEHGGLESRKLSAVLQVTLDGSGNVTVSQYASEGKTGFWTTLPPSPGSSGSINFTYLDWLADKSKPAYYGVTSVDRQGNESASASVTPLGSANGNILEWIKPDDSKIRYFNIYYSGNGAPPADQKYRIASISVGTKSGGITFGNYNQLDLLKRVVAYPNPYNPKTAKNSTLKFANLLGMSLKMSVYNTEGKLIKEVSDTNISWDGKNQEGELVGRGIYYVVISNSSGDSVIRKVALVK